MGLINRQRCHRILCPGGLSSSVNRPRSGCRAVCSGGMAATFGAVPAGVQRSRRFDVQIESRPEIPGSLSKWSVNGPAWRDRTPLHNPARRCNGEWINWRIIFISGSGFDFLDLACRRAWREMPMTDSQWPTPGIQQLTGGESAIGYCAAGAGLVASGK